MQYTTNFFKLLLISILFFATACEEDDSAPEYDVSAGYDFEAGMEGWTAVFAEYPIGNAEAMNLSYDHTTLPPSLPQDRMALELSGTNTSDNLLMMVKKKISGLKPDTEYDIYFEVEVASTYPEDRPGIGGSPGGDVAMKVGAVQKEPKAVEGQLGYEAYVPNWTNTGLEQGQRTEDVVVIGNIGIEGNGETYELITLTNDAPDLTFTKQSDSNGELWIMVGTDSGFEGNTTLYYDAIRVYFNET